MLGLVVVNIIQSVPFSIGLWFSVLHLWRPHPHCYTRELWISYSLNFVGQFRAWWILYLIHAGPERAAHYQVRFGKPTIFCLVVFMIRTRRMFMLHVATLATLFGLLVNWSDLILESPTLSETP